MIAKSLLPLTETAGPTDSAEVADVIRRALAEGKAVYPIGGGTRLDYGVRPTKPGIGLVTTGLDRVVDYPAKDLTITVEAGLTVAELSQILAGESQRLPLDVRWADAATIGGVIASNTFGPRRYRCGTIRDYLLGFSAVDGRGQVFAGGGRVVKNAAGYNMPRLMVGSLGTLAVLTQVTLMVRPLPETSAIVACQVPDFDAAERLLAELVRTQALPVAIEFLTGPAWCEILGSPAATNGVGRVLIGLEGTGAEVEGMIGELERQIRGTDIASVEVIRDEDCECLWSVLVEGVPSSQPDEEGTSYVLLQAHVPPSRVVEAVAAFCQADAKTSIQSHAGDGVIRVAVGFRPASKAATICRRLRMIVESLEGTLVVAGCSPDVELTRETVWGPPGDARPVMEAIKRQFDPEGILNPGRFVYEDS